MGKRHRWRRGGGWTVCQDCGCRYQHGNITRSYEQPDGRRTARAEECRPLVGPTEDGKPILKMCSEACKEAAIARGWCPDGAPTDDEDTAPRRRKSRR